MKLGELLRGMVVLHAEANPGAEILGLAYDSREVSPGTPFLRHFR